MHKMNLDVTSLHNGFILNIIRLVVLSFTKYQRIGTIAHIVIYLCCDIYPTIPYIHVLQFSPHSLFA